MAFWQGLFLFSVTVGLAYACGDHFECPPLWTSYGGNCYRFFGQGKPWADAEAHCQQFFTRYGQGHLASIHNSGENGFIHELWKTSLQTLGGTHRMWIGLTDQEEEGLFEWTDKTALDYNDWQANQPDDYLNREDCVEIAMREEHMGGWNDHFCNSNSRIHQYMCKMPTFLP